MQFLHMHCLGILRYHVVQLFALPFSNGKTFKIVAFMVMALSCLKQVVYAILHRQEVFQPFKNHPRFNELLENIYTVCYLCFMLIVISLCILRIGISFLLPLLIFCLIDIDLIIQVLDFFNSRMDMQRTDGEWSVDKVLQLIIVNCRSWHGDRMKVKSNSMFYY